MSETVTKRVRATTSQPSQRMLRVGEQVRHAVVALLQRGQIDEPLLRGKIISVSEVRMSPDLKIATAFISAMGKTETEIVVKALAKHTKYLRGQLGHDLRQMRSIPGIRFKADTAFEYFAKIDKLLHSDVVRKDVEASDTNQNND